jgi:hypothetical protein
MTRFLTRSVVILYELMKAAEQMPALCVNPSSSIARAVLPVIRRYQRYFLV